MGCSQADEMASAAGEERWCWRRQRLSLVLLRCRGGFNGVMQWAGGMLACFKMGRLWSKTDRQTDRQRQTGGSEATKRGQQRSWRQALLGWIPATR